MIHDLIAFLGNFRVISAEKLGDFFSLGWQPCSDWSPAAAAPLVASETGCCTSPQEKLKIFFSFFYQQHMCYVRYGERLTKDIAL
jgi:hypothetical protein